MKVHIISCQIFEPYIQVILGQDALPYSYELTYYEMDRHNHPKSFHALLQEKIDQIKDVDLILLVYGICGNVSNHLHATHCPIMIPKVHDCASILLGGKSHFLEVFKDRLSNPWLCLAHDENHEGHAYIDAEERERILKKYGEDNLAYIEAFFQNHYEKRLYLSLGLKEDAKKIASLEEEVEIVVGNLRYLKDVLWLNSKDLLKIEVGEEVIPLYDQVEVMTKSKH